MSGLPLTRETPPPAAAAAAENIRRGGATSRVWGIALQRNISDSGAAFPSGLITFHRPVQSPYNRMSRNKIPSLVVAAAAALACYGAYDASAKTTGQHRS